MTLPRVGLWTWDNVGKGDAISQQEPPAAEFEVRVPPELEAGAYANFLAVWHTAYEFTLDFSVTQPPELGDEGQLKMPCRVVSRVKIPVALVFEILKALNTNMTQFEDQYGEIEPPKPRPPESQGGPE